ncbi:hypothetical protein FKH18_25075 [Salmonella enterica]|uniref:Uncharacterized protein n=2 Tax=Salmonella enterica TaxID=28901 RepID=A0A619I3Y1_SALER|nr:hypothetical protein [Salmonella enterica subsp. enterica serovar Java]EAN9728442.1 hypothetical protein [Salmonella enterica]EBV8393884.1 hypothetical protein [Salmonella enterica subsp. enterica serovar Virchow]ECW9805403.1 hypothetical protein [Salmonella enterica subsp. enterica serovar Poona]EDV9615026.1 hypothetical protein [Salmonella enterica subsp. enterica serovar Paratyphi B]EEM8442495.1 hypothetical protein [Salmonella enterica subsp. enterica serovar Oranienburg]EFV0933772.1 h
MSTKKYNLDPGDDWMQITDGNQVKPVLLQVISGEIYFCESATKPAPNADAHIFSSGPNAFLSITAPDSVWCKARKVVPPTVIAVTR